MSYDVFVYDPDVQERILLVRAAIEKEPKMPCPQCGEVQVTLNYSLPDNEPWLSCLNCAFIMRASGV